MTLVENAKMMLLICGICNIEALAFPFYAKEMYVVYQLFVKNMFYLGKKKSRKSDKASQKAKVCNDFYPL